MVKEPSKYSVKIAATGFKTFVATQVKIDAGREYKLNALLEVGQIVEQVVVTGGAEPINASNAELSMTISREQIRELPLNGRNPLALLTLTPGAGPTTNSINGQRSSSTTITRDGLNVTTSPSSQSRRKTPAPNSVAEHRSCNW
jgi:hypothetical protein